METYSLDGKPLANFSLILADKKGMALDLSPAVLSLSWEASLQNAASKLDATLAPFNNLAQLIELADTLALFAAQTDSGLTIEVLRTYVWDIELNSAGGTKLSGYDLLKYMLESKDDFAFYSVSAASIFNQICTGFNIPNEAPPDTGHIIPKLIMRNARPYDVLVKALVLTREANGRRFFPRVNNGKLFLFEPTAPKLVWAIEAGHNMLNNNVKSTLDGMVNKVKVIGHTQDDEGEATSYVAHEESDPDSISKYGLLQAVRYWDENATDKPSAVEIAKTVLKKLNKVSRTINTQAIGIMPLWPGDLVYTRDSGTGLVGVYYVESVKNEMKPGVHVMTVFLRFDNLLEDPDPGVS